MLVDTFNYDGNLTYTFTLRSGVSFQDGTPLTAADVVASINRFILTPGNGAALGGNLASVEATSDQVVTLTLKSPSPIVPTLLTTAYIMPASLVKDRPITDPIQQLVCTGPYKLVSYQPDQGITLQRWDGYVSRTEPSSGATGAKHAYVDEIDMKPTPEASARLQSVETGAADIGPALPLDDYQALSTSATAVPALTSPLSGSTVVFNKEQGVMANVKMRQAFLAALDMTQVMAAGFGDPQFYNLDGSIIPKINPTWYSTAGTENYNHPDLTKVKQLLQEAGYNGEPIRWITTKDDPTWYGPAEPSQQLLKEAGLNIDLQVMDQASVISRRADATAFDLFSSGIPTYADPLLLPYLQDAFPGKWTNPDKNVLLQNLATETDPAARKATWDQLQELIYTDVPFLKFGETRVLLAVSKKTHVENVDDLTTSYYNVWLDQ
jgi:peptide/nickel transport system substrate-binding protein